MVDAPIIGSEYQPTKREEELVWDTIHLFSQLQTGRNTFASHWEEVAELIAPESRNTFFYGNFNWPGQKKTDRQIDATGMLALNRFTAIVDSLMTPRNAQWHKITSPDPYVMKDRATRLWFEDTTNRLFRARYAPHANFSSQNASVFKGLGAFGNGTMFIDRYRGVRGGDGLRYMQIPLGETFYIENTQGEIDGMIRWFHMTAAQAVEFFGKDNPRLPPQIKTAAEGHSPIPFDFLHRVTPRDNFDPERPDHRRMRYTSFYVSMVGKCLVKPESGFNSFPYAPTRYEQWRQSDGPYGRGPAMFVLPALKTLNAEKATFLKQGHRAVDPVLLTADDGLVDFNMRPGALNPGGVNPDGHPMVVALQTGDIQISEKMMAEEKGLIQDAFLVSLFQILTETPQMTATEVIERMNEKGMLVAPTVGRQESEYVGTGLVPRELDLMSQLGMLAPMPPRLREAGGNYIVESTSPLAKAMKAQNAAGFMRTLETVKELVQITGDQSLLDPFNFDVAVPGIADIQSVPESWMADDNMIATKRQSRAQAAQQQQQIQAMPAQAAMMKAQAVQAKAGVGQTQQMPTQEQGVQPAPPLTGGQ